MFGLCRLPYTFSSLCKENIYKSSDVITVFILHSTALGCQHEEKHGLLTWQMSLHAHRKVEHTFTEQGF